MAITSLTPRKVAWGQLAWVAVGLFWGLSSYRDFAAAGPEVDRQIYILPMVAGVFIVLTAGWVFLSSMRDGDGATAASDVPRVRSTLGEVALLMAIFVAAWLVMPYLGLVLTAVATFAALAVFYRDMKPWAVVANLVVVFFLLAYGAAELLNMPLLRSSVFVLPF